jgi:hypothetical protein
LLEALAEVKAPTVAGKDDLALLTKREQQVTRLWLMDCPISILPACFI